ncbi:2,3-diaminopropionate biosynthesis protein SbnB [Paenibacillus sp. LHD-117]|uniref:2,3-diaminopropionate biosynthesis protein SbnB n=1 Tax=Paenibacillus sp. LHD-117 TaxID=3071412 RepID=UPI0027E0472F|nr:2,3-diaminopropionate biosynthesis protein SbnB [Paenibacillus sp. LHD-117]MDQ6423343.1 2,3-diaminopropionate biosynthesis protein SbnB [Paenibacillus sp. LHD-117]
MLYLGEEHLRAIGYSWRGLVDRIQQTVRIMDSGDYAQPLKPYLRYRDPRNRIIAMPAYIGGSVGTAGLKWIASFPGNYAVGLPRAHSVTVLNDADTGEPLAIVNSALVSAARTAAVSGLMLREWLKQRLLDNDRDSAEEGLRIGIIGFGPIGQMHKAMCLSLFDEHIDYMMLYDIRGVRLDGSRGHSGAAGDVATAAQGQGQADGSARPQGECPRRRSVPIRVAGSWQELYQACNVIITCTVSDKRYIHTPPAPGSLLLDVSLRDYGLEAIQGIRSVVVDDWTEVCRENTDIELLHREAGLNSEQATTLADVVCRDAIARFDSREPLLFCPMGMAAFDVAIAEWYLRKGEELGVGVRLT